MKNRLLCAAAVLMVLLAGCAAKEEQTPDSVQPFPGASAGDRLPTAAEVEREETTRLKVEGGEVPAVLHIGQGYSLYIPLEGWTLELDKDEELPKDRWMADERADVSLTVYHYEDMSTMVALDRYMKGSPYSFSSAKGGTLGAPLCGTDAAGTICEVMAAESLNGVTYVIAWEYGAESAGYGPELTAMAGSFELTE